jgi:hypothetical protein
LYGLGDWGIFPFFFFFNVLEQSEKSAMVQKYKGYPKGSVKQCKGCNSKNAYFDKFVFVILQLNNHPILKICVSTPHNYPLIMGGRHKNFEDWMNIKL